MENLYTEASEFMEQINYGLSRRFIETWRHKYGTHLISLFQDKIVNSLETQRPIDKEKFISTIVKKNQYNRQVILDFFNDIEIGLYRPLIR